MVHYLQSLLHCPKALYGDGWTEAQVLEALHVATWAPYLIGLNAALGARPPAGTT